MKLAFGRICGFRVWVKGLGWATLGAGFLNSSFGASSGGSPCSAAVDFPPWQLGFSTLNRPVFHIKPAAFPHRTAVFSTPKPAPKVSISASKPRQLGRFSTPKRSVFNTNRTDFPHQICPFSASKRPGFHTKAGDVVHQNGSALHTYAHV